MSTERSMKTIVFITREIVPFYYGGIGTLFMSVARMLADDGHQVCFLSEFNKSFDKDIFSHYYGSIPIHFVDHHQEKTLVDYSPSGGLVSMSRLAYAFAVEEAFTRLAQKCPPDIVISADYGAEACLLHVHRALGKFPGIQFVVHLSGALYEVLRTYEGPVPNGEYSELHEPQNRLVCAMEDACMLLADHVVSPSLVSWKQVRTRLGMEAIRASIIPNLLDPGFVAQKAKHVIRRGPENEVLFIGRLDRHKGADIIVELFLEYIEHYESHHRLVLLGRDCFCKEYGKTFLDEWRGRIPLYCRDRIVFAGQINHKEVSRYLEKACLCVFPSRWEVFGIVCLEAMTYGVPSCVSKNTGLEEILGPELEDFCFDFDNDRKRFLSTMHELLSTPDGNVALRKKMRARAVDVLRQGQYGYRKLINDCTSSNDGADTITAWGKIVDALQATSEISGHLGHDFNKIVDFFKLSDRQVKTIIQQPKKQKTSVLFKLKKFLTSLDVRNDG